MYYFIIFLIGLFLGMGIVCFSRASVKSKPKKWIYKETGEI